LQRKSLRAKKPGFSGFRFAPFFAHRAKNASRPYNPLRGHAAAQDMGHRLAAGKAMRIYHLWPPPRLQPTVTLSGKRPEISRLCFIEDGYLPGQKQFGFRRDSPYRFYFS
jgi:hypothetical protein